MIDVIDTLISAFIFGSALWFFIFQSPFLIKKMGRQKFVPLQMMTVRFFFNVMVVSCIVVVALNLDDHATHVALIFTLINRFAILPRALRAGGRSLSEQRSPENESEVAGFVDYGAGQSTKLYHRLIVLFVLGFLVAIARHLTHT